MNNNAGTCMTILDGEGVKKIYYTLQVAYLRYKIWLVHIAPLGMIGSYPTPIEALPGT